jgi:hypothetical protein
MELVIPFHPAGRITVMFCSLTHNSRILRLAGAGRAVRPDDVEFASLRTHFGNLRPGVHAAIVIDVERIADACGYAVPYYDLIEERPALDAHHPKAPDEAYISLVQHNRHRIDGPPALNADHPLPSSIER